MSMNCQRVQDSFIDYQDGSLPADEAAALRTHLTSCPTCQREWSALQEITRKLDALPAAEEPSPRLSEQFYAMLETHQREADARARSRSPATASTGSSPCSCPTGRCCSSPSPWPCWWPAFTRAIASWPSRPWSHRADNSAKTELAALKAQMDSMNQLVTYSLLQQQSTSDRLKTVLATMDLKTPDRKVLSDLVGALAFDPSVNVRLSAVDALAQHADDSLVRAGVISALSRERAPLVQVAMIEYAARRPARDADAAAGIRETQPRRGHRQERPRGRPPRPRRAAPARQRRQAHRHSQERPTTLSHMKNHIPSLRILSAALIAFLLAGATTLRGNGDEGTTATVKLSAPGKPSTLRLDMPWADIHVVGVDGDDVTVVSTIAQKGAKPTRPGGLRRLDDEVSFEVSEHDNVVTLRIAGDNPWAGHDAEFKISVPRAMALDLKTEAGGDLVVENTDGDIDVSSMNGDIVLKGISGATTVQTMNGEVRATYAKAPQKLVSITSMNGEIDLRVPADTKANVRLRTHNGSILTDFDETVLKTKSEGSSSSSYTYAYGAATASRDAARAAADAMKAAAMATRDAVRDAVREARVAKEEADDEAAPTPEAAPAAPGTPVPPHTPHPARAPRAPLPPITGGKVVSGTLNGGGIDIKISSMNGEIMLRQSK